MLKANRQFKKKNKISVLYLRTKVCYSIWKELSFISNSGLNLKISVEDTLLI